MGTDGDRSKRGRPIDPYVDEALRTATFEVISKSGWRGATIERIAERAGVARTTIYRRHGSVHGVLLLLLHDMYSETPPPDTGSLRGDLIAMMSAVAVSWRDPMFVDFICAMLAAQRENTDLAAAYRAQFQVRRNDTTRMITQARARGEIRPDADGSLLLDLISGWFIQRAVSYGTGLEDADIVHVVDTLLLAFLIPAA